MPNPRPPLRLAVVGAGGWGREVLDIVGALAGDVSSEFELVGVLDDAPSCSEILARRGVDHLGSADLVHDVCDRYVIAIGDGDLRRSIDHRIGPGSAEPARLVHPRSWLGSLCSLAPGSVINVGATITTNVTIGRHGQVHANATVGHDAVIGDFVSVFPGATISGAAILEEGATIGTGANVLPGIRVGAGAMVGAGAVVVDDVAACETVVGVPARRRPGR
jgi:sugar O-acyltransferase (sialic acid O-acetyltransferase NeuD family)